jgi:hypothetical protein
MKADRERDGEVHRLGRLRLVETPRVAPDLLRRRRLHLTGDDGVVRERETRLDDGVEEALRRRGHPLVRLRELFHLDALVHERLGRAVEAPRVERDVPNVNRRCASRMKSSTTSNETRSPLIGSCAFGGGFDGSGHAPHVIPSTGADPSPRREGRRSRRPPCRASGPCRRRGRRGRRREDEPRP